MENYEKNLIRFTCNYLARVYNFTMPDNFVNDIHNEFTANSLKYK